MRALSFAAAIGLVFTAMSNPAFAQDERLLNTDADAVIAPLWAFLYSIMSVGVKESPRGSGGGPGLLFDLIRDLAEMNRPRATQRRKRTSDLTGANVVEMFESYGDPYATGIFGVIPPKWSVEKFPDGDNPLNELLPEGSEYANKYAWAGDFHSQCGIGVMVHSAGTAGYVGALPTFPTLTFRNAEAELLTRQSFRDPLNSLGGTVLGLRAALVTGCPDENTIEAIISSIGDTDDNGVLVAPSTLYRVTVDLEEDAMAIDVLIPDLTPVVNLNSIRAMVQGVDGDPCHIMFAALNENGIPPALVPSIWTMDVCADDVSSTLTETRFFLEGQSTDSLVNRQVVWDFECDDEGPLGLCWYNMVTFEFDASKASGLDGVPLLYYGSKTDIAPPTSGPKVEAFAPVRQVDTDDFLDSSALALEILDQERVMACTLSGFTYQVVEATPGFSISLDDIDGALTALEIGEGQACYLCSTSSNDCKEVRVPGLVATTTYIWQVETCGDYLFFGTYDLTETLGTLFFGLVQQFGGFQLELLGLPTDSLSLFVEGAGTLLLSIFLQKYITRNDIGFDIWYLPKDRVDNGWFRPLVLDGFRGLEEGSGNACNNDYWAEYDSDASYTDGVRQMVCHSQPDGSLPTLLVGNAVFDPSSTTFSSTYVIRLEDECSP